MENKKPIHFADAQFMTAKEKGLVVRNWKTFLKHGLKKEHFTKRLYQHLHLHCGFIVHYNIHGFYSTYFEAGQDTEEFFKTLCSNINGLYGSGEYHDLDTAMLEVYQEFKGQTLTTTEDDIHHRLDVLEACTMRARQDGEFARDLLSKLRI